MKLTEGGRLERPNLCWICKRTPPVGSAVIDTEKYFEGWPHDLQGRQYVCEACATQMASFFGFAARDEVEIAQTAQARAEAVVRGVKQRLDTMIADLKNLAADPSVFMEDTSATETSVGRGRVGFEADAAVDGAELGDGDSEELVAEAGDSATEGDDSGAEGGHSETSDAQPGTRQHSGSTA